jgi:hypothetical protein
MYDELARDGIALDADRLAYLSNWVTPNGVPRRYDTRFYVTEVPEGTAAAPDRTEVIDAAWTTPEAALSRNQEGEWQVEFPTLRHLELLAGFDDIAAVLKWVQAAGEITPTEPRLAVAGDGSWRVLLPGEAGYEEAIR